MLSKLTTIEKKIQIWIVIHKKFFFSQKLSILYILYSTDINIYILCKIIWINGDIQWWIYSVYIRSAPDGSATHQCHMVGYAQPTVPPPSTVVEKASATHHKTHYFISSMNSKKTYRISMLHFGIKLFPLKIMLLIQNRDKVSIINKYPGIKSKLWPRRR